MIFDAEIIGFKVSVKVANRVKRLHGFDHLHEDLLLRKLIRDVVAIYVIFNGVLGVFRLNKRIHSEVSFSLKAGYGFDSEILKLFVMKQLLSYVLRTTLLFVAGYLYC